VNLKTHKQDLIRFLVISCMLLLSSCSLMSSSVIDINEQHYRIYRADGSSASLDDLLTEASQVDVTFLGESHNDPVAHYLELLLFESLADNMLALSLEMFETDIQYVLDEYLDDVITEVHLLESARAWDNYDSDYKPLIEFAKNNSLPVLAANAPRRYVNLVGREGQESLQNLGDEAKRFLPSLPYANASESYTENFLNLMQAMNAQSGQEPDDNHDNEEITPEQAEAAREQEERLQRTLAAQSLWDAGMAWSIASYLTEHSDTRVLHVNGSFHSAEGLGILDHLRRYRSQTSMLVITITADESFPEFDTESMLNQGDFVIVTDPSLPRSF